jgi:hypothetical protein
LYPFHRLKVTNNQRSRVDFKLFAENISRVGLDNSYFQFAHCFSAIWKILWLRRKLADLIWKGGVRRDNTDVPVKSTRELQSAEFHQDRGPVKPLHDRVYIKLHTFLRAVLLSAVTVKQTCRVGSRFLFEDTRCLYHTKQVRINNRTEQRPNWLAWQMKIIERVSLSSRHRSLRYDST